MEVLLSQFTRLTDASMSRLLRWVVRHGLTNLPFCGSMEEFLWYLHNDLPRGMWIKFILELEKENVLSQIERIPTEVIDNKWERITADHLRRFKDKSMPFRALFQAPLLDIDTEQLELILHILQDKKIKPYSLSAVSKAILDSQKQDKSWSQITHKTDLHAIPPEWQTKFNNLPVGSKQALAKGLLGTPIFWPKGDTDITSVLFEYQESLNYFLEQVEKELLCVEIDKITSWVTKFVSDAFPQCLDDHSKWRPGWYRKDNLPLSHLRMVSEHMSAPTRFMKLYTYSTDEERQVASGMLGCDSSVHTVERAIRLDPTIRAHDIFEAQLLLEHKMDKTCFVMEVLQKRPFTKKERKGIGFVLGFKPKQMKKKRFLNALVRASFQTEVFKPDVYGLLEQILDKIPQREN